MSSLYKSLSDEDLKIEKESLKNFEKKLREPSSEGALRAAVVGAFLISLISLVGSSYLFQSLNKEKRQREAVEAAQIQIREKAAAFEQDAEKSKAEIIKLTEQVKGYASFRQEIGEQLAESRKKVNALQVKLKEIEEKSFAMQKETEEIQTDFESQPMGPQLPQEQSKSKDSKSGTAGEKSVVNEPSVIQEPQVLSVNKKFNFIVTNVGLKNNIEIGDPLNVEREGKVIGTAVVEKIYDNFAAATIQTQPKDAPIKEGDAVRKA